MMNIKVYAGRLKNKKDLENSSSGGAFSALSNAFLDNGDAVVASRYDYQKQQLKFTIIFNKISRDEARGSKYFQSYAGEIFRISEKWLWEHPDKKMLFIGMGCQADAFLNYMKAKGLYERILVVDIICYGVVSPEFWRKYITYKSNEGVFKVSGLSFKDKRKGWLHPTALVRLDEEECSIQDYVNVYYSKNALRPSCYKCPYTKIDRKTDITIGDFWGIDQQIPDFYDPMGNSLLLIHTNRGQELFDYICDSIDYRESNTEECMQSHLECSTKCPEGRSRFWNLYKQKGIYEVMKKYATDSLFDKIKKRAKKTLTKLRGRNKTST